MNEPIETCGHCGHALELVRPGKSQCVRCEYDQPDYYAVYIKRGPKARASFLTHVCTRGGRDRALRVARQEGHKLPRWSYAVRVGKEGYFAALRQSFQR